MKQDFCADGVQKHQGYLGILLNFFVFVIMRRQMEKKTCNLGRGVVLEKKKLDD